MAFDKLLKYIYHKYIVIYSAETNKRLLLLLSLSLLKSNSYRELLLSQNNMF